MHKFSIRFENLKRLGLKSPTGVRGVINGNAGKAAALPKFPDTLTLSQPGGQIMPNHWLYLPKKIP